MTIRFLVYKDIVLYREARLRSLKESPFAFSDSYEDQLKKATDFYDEIEMTGSPPEKFTLGAFSEQDELVGFVKFKRDQRSKARHRASLHSLYVIPEFRGKGIAKMMITELFKIIEPIPGLEQLQLSSIISHNSTVSFYEKMGFQMLGGILEKDLIIEGKYVDAMYMVKFLAPTLQSNTINNP
jgi:ribosomal protein S18 acetylase RimI-like enzyme